MKTKACGLTQSSLVTIPLTVIGFFESYSASKEWCAVSGFTATSIRENAINRQTVLSLIVFLLQPPALAGTSRGASSHKCRFRVVFAEIFLNILVRDPLNGPAPGPWSSVSAW